MRRYLFIIGAQRSGTTLLAETLDRHPAVHFAKPIRPEPKYLLKSEGNVDLSAYEAKYFAAVPDSVLRGEKSTSYIEYPRVAESIREHFPDVRCIAVLRDPVERAISNYWFSVENGFEKRPPEEALQPTEDDAALVAGVSASPFAYLRRGRYLGYLQAYADILGKERLLVLQTEQLIHGGSSWRQVYDFLALERREPPGEMERANSVPRERPVAAATLGRLAAYYEPHNAELARHYGIDLSLWRRPE
jgi:hypothetical protein